MNQIKLYNGDCLEILDDLIADGIKVDAVITDPPYGTTACKWDSIIPFDKLWNKIKLLRKDEANIILFSKTIATLYDSSEEKFYLMFYSSET